MESIMTPQEAAERLGLSPRRIQQLCKQQRLGRRVGGRYRIEKCEVERFAREHALMKPGRPPRKMVG